MNLNKKLLNWLIDDGIAIRLITDHKRNQYYEEIIKNRVNGKNCIDVGFGTGILSLLAVKHGAKSVRAYEVNADRYKLGLEIIKHCNLEDKIELVNQRFNTDLIKDSDELIIHEIIGATIYNEALYCLFNDKIPVCPSNYKTDFVLYEVDKKDIESLKLIQDTTKNLNRTQIEFNTYKNRNFTLGIDIGEKYEEKVFGLINDFYNYQYTNTVEKLNPKIVSDFTEEQRNLFYSLKNGIVACTIEIDYNQTELFVGKTISKDVLKNKTYILVPNYYFSDNNLEFDMQGTHWNERLAWQEAVILDNVNSDLYIRQNLTNGIIHYWTND